MDKLEVASKLVGKVVSFSNQEGDFTGTVIEVKDAYTVMVDIGEKIKCSVDLFEIKEVRTA